MAQLREVIAGTLSHHAEIRQKAEGHLNEALKNPGHSLEVLRLIASSDAADAAVRQAAAVHFKNLVKSGWDEAKDEEDKKGIVISAQDRVTVKNHLVELMCTVPPQIQAQISETISLIATVDFPDKWDNLLPELIQKFNSPDLAVVNGVLMTANSIFKRFRYVQRSDELYRVIIYTLKYIEQPLLTMFIQMGKAIDAYANDAQQLKPRFEALRSMCRIFFSLNFQDLPEFFEDHMKDWMEEFAKYLQYKNPLLVDETEEDEPSPLDRLQAAIVENLKMYADKDEEPFIPFLPNFTSLVWNLLVGLTAYPKHDTLVTTSIKFLSSLIEKRMHNDLFKEQSTLQQIVSRIVIPNLMVREVDEEKFEDDPQEFILTEIEGSDSESRRKCSRDLLRAMCRQFEAQTTAICSEHITSMLGEFTADNNKWTAKDTAIHLMLGIAIRTESHQGVSATNDNVNLMEFFTSQVLPELQDSNHASRPMVKATALKFVCTFRNQFTKDQLVSLMPMLINHLTSPSVVVHTLAAYAIERNMMAKDDAAAGKKSYKITRADLQPLLQNLFTGLFAIIDNVELNENEHVMKCTMRALSRAGEDVIPVTDIVFNRLAAALERVCKNPRNPSYNHYLFESIAALVRNVCSKDPSMIGQLEAMLFPPFQTVLQMDIVEFTPYVFQVLAQLLEFRPTEAGLGEAYSSLFAPLLTASLWENKGNIPGLVRLLHAYLKKAATEVIGQLVAFLGIFQKLNAAKATENSAFDLLNAVTIYAPQENLAPHLKTIFTIILTKLQHGKSNKYPGFVVKYFGLFVGLYGAQAFFDYMNQIQPGVALTMLVQIWIPKLPAATNNQLEAKIQVVGLTRLLCDTPALVADDNGKQIWAHALNGVVKILTSTSFSSADAEFDADPEIQLGSDSSFTQLSLARSKPEDPFSSIGDPMDMFARSLQSFSSSQPGVLGPIIQQAAGPDPKFSSALQTVMQKTGVNLV